MYQPKLGLIISGVLLLGASACSRLPGVEGRVVESSSASERRGKDKTDYSFSASLLGSAQSLRVNFERFGKNLLIQGDVQVNVSYGPFNYDRTLREATLIDSNGDPIGGYRVRAKGDKDPKPEIRDFRIANGEVHRFKTPCPDFLTWKKVVLAEEDRSDGDIKIYRPSLENIKSGDLYRQEKPPIHTALSLFSLIQTTNDLTALDGKVLLATTGKDIMPLRVQVKREDKKKGGYQNLYEIRIVNKDGSDFNDTFVISEDSQQNREVVSMTIHPKKPLPAIRLDPKRR